MPQPNDTYYITAPELKAILRKYDKPTLSHADVHELAEFIMHQLFANAKRRARNLSEAKFHEAAVAAMVTGVGPAQLETLLNQATVNEVDYVEPTPVLQATIVVPFEL